VSAAGWAHPLPGYNVTSGFRTPDRPSHDGVDLPAPKGTPIRAAAAGEVIKVRCNAIDRRDGNDWGCDRDGDPELTGGCDPLTAPCRGYTGIELRSSPVYIGRSTVRDR